MKRLIIVLGLALTWVFPAAAQEENCTIELSQVEALFAQAQAAVSDGDLETALEYVTQMREALESIEHRCAASAIRLTESFEAPDGAFSLSYPEGWQFGEYDSSDGQGGMVFFGSSQEALEALDNSEPMPGAGEQLLAVLVGPSAMLNDTRAVAPATLEDVMTSAVEMVKEEYSAVGATEYFSLNDRRAGAFEFNADAFEAVMIVVEYRRGELYAIAIGIAAPGELDRLRPVVEAVAATVRARN